MNNRTLQKRIPLEKARNSLAAIWFVGAAAPFTILILQSILGKYTDPDGTDAVQKVWAWFTPNIAPALALIIGVMGAMAMATDQERRSVKPFFLTLSKGLSLCYLLALTLTLALEPFGNIHGMDLFTISNFWLGPLQSLAVAAITVLFTSQDKVSKDSRPSPGT